MSGGALNNYCSLDKLLAKLTCRCYNLIQFSPPFHVWADNLHICGVSLCKYFFTYCLLTLLGKETLGVLKRFNLFVGSLSAKLICLPLKCVKALYRIIIVG